MTEEAEGAPEVTEDGKIAVVWREVPSFIGEAVVGHAVAGGMHRFVMAELVFNPSPGAETPYFRPNLNLVIPHVVLPTLIANLQDAYDRLEAQAATDEE